MKQHTLPAAITTFTPETQQNACAPDNSVYIDTYATITPPPPGGPPFVGCVALRTDLSRAHIFEP